jgi:hypothetical protein
VRAKAFLVPAEVERGIEIALRCDTVWIDTDRALLTLSWRGLVTVDTPDEEALGALVIAAESRGREIGYAQITKLLRDGITSTTDSDTLTESRSLRPRPESLAEIDSDLLPTPGAFRPKRPLPSVEVVAASPLAGAAVVLPAATPVVIAAEDSAGPVSWEELTGSDLIDSVIIEEAKTITRIDARKIGTAAVADEPSTAPRIPLAGLAEVKGELGAADYARIAVAVERGEAARVLSDYGLGLPDLPRLQRVWTTRSVMDPLFAEAFAQAVAKARRG